MRSVSEEGPAHPRPTVLAEDLSVRYGKGGGNWGLQGFTARFEAGITGLVGPNGAGKTTLLQVLAGCLECDGGQVEIDGASPSSFISRNGIGFLPESPPLPGYLSVRDFLSGLPVSGMNGQGRRDPHGFSSIFPEDILSKPLSSLSMGQRKRVALAGALSGTPSVLLLDEPTNGLDPLAIRDLRKTLLAQKALGILILISSHHLDELQRITDALVFVQDGKVLGAWSREKALADFSSLEDLFNHHFGDGGDG